MSSTEVVQVETFYYFTRKWQPSESAHTKIHGDS